MLKHLLPLIQPHTCYVEAFAGGLALLLAKERSPVEVVNDVNGDLIALYRSIQYHLPELLREIGHMISSRRTLHDFVAQPGITEIQRAARFYFRNRISFGGSGDSMGVSKTRGGGVAFRNEANRDLLGNARERLDGVVVENVSYERLMALYDAPATFWFFDPPYVGATPRAYAGWTQGDVTAFAERVRGLAGKWLVTLDDSKENRAAFEGCAIQRVETANGTVNRRLEPGAKFAEIIIRPRD